MASNTASLPSYHLSTEILGHTGDVRAVKAFTVTDESCDYVLTASRDHTACLWIRQEGSEILLRKTISHHKGYVSSLCVIPADCSSGRDKPLIVTGSQDNQILVHSMDPDIQEPLEQYSGHTGLVSCIIYQHNNIVSVSWDSTMRIWQTATQCDTIQAHKPAVWAISGLYQFDGTKRALTGGADKVIRLWELPTKICIQEYIGHSDVIRDIKVINCDIFLSAANDCSIRKWNIHTAQCLREYNGHEAFVYSVSPFNNGLEDDFASCGEDGTLRVWRDGDCVQVIQLPCISVWSVSCFDNDDIVVGSSDSIARVFTKEITRKASDQHISSFLSKLEEHKLSKSNKSIDVQNLPNMEALSEPGKKTGDTKLINNNGNAEVYQWDTESMQWVKIGDAIGEAPKNGNIYKGKEYDYVFDIDIDDEGPYMRKLKLPYNKTDDPFDSAEKFLNEHDIPIWYLDQVADFIMKNADVQFTGVVISDPFTGGGRYIPGQGNNDSTPQLGSGGSIHDPFTGGGRYIPGQGNDDGVPQLGSGGPINDPFTGGSRYQPEDSSHPPSTQRTDSTTISSNPHFPVNTYKTFISTGDYNIKIITKIREFSDSIHNCNLTQDQIKSIEVLCSSLTSSGHVDPSSLPLLSLMLQWPIDNLFPVLDIIRLTMLNEHGNQYFTGDISFLPQIQTLACGSEALSKNQLLVLRILANSLVHSSGVQWIISNIKQVLIIIDSLVTNGMKNIQIAISTVLLNYCRCCHVTDNETGISECVQIGIKILRSDIHDIESKFRIMIGFGTLVLKHKLILMTAIGSEDVTSLLAPLCDVTDPPKVSECALQLIELLMIEHIMN